MSKSEAIDRVAELLSTTFAVDRGSISPATELFDGGLGLDSMAAGELLAVLERQFEIVIEDDDVRMENFQTVAAVTDFVVRKKAQNAAAAGPRR